MRNIFEILEKLNMDKNELKTFEYIEIKNITKIRNNEFLINFSTQNFLPINEIEYFLVSLKKYKEINFSAVFNVMNNINILNKIIPYIKFISKFYKSNFKSVLFQEIIDYNKITLDNNFLILEVPDIENEAFKNDISILENKLNNFGFKISFSLKEKKINLSKIPDYKLVNIESNLTNKNQNNFFMKNNNNSFPYKKKITSILSLRKENQFNVENILEGKVFDFNKIKLKKKDSFIYTFSVTDYTESILVKIFSNNQFNMDSLKNKWVRFKGKLQYDNFLKEKIMFVSLNKNNENISLIPSKDIQIQDNEKNKRIELHIHTKMSTMDGIGNVKDYMEYAYKLGYKAIAITDLYNIQSFPDAHNIFMKEYKNKNFKLIYGSELGMINKNVNYVINPKNNNLKKCKYVFFDIETTGLSVENDEIIEFGAVIFDENGNRKDEDFLIKTSKKLPNFIVELTGLTNNKLEKEGISIKEAIFKILNIFKNAILVAHNATFDFDFLNSWLIKLGYEKLKNTIIDTLPLSRYIWPKMKNHRLETLAKKNQISYKKEEAHRADYDANVLANIYYKMLDILEGLKCNYDVDLLKLNSNEVYKKIIDKHITVLVKNKKGLSNLFELITKSHTKYFYTTPKIFKDELEKKREGLFIGSGCINSEIFELAFNKSEEQLLEAIKFYDYIEVFPPSLYVHLIQKEETTNELIMKNIKKIIKCAKKLNKIVIASGDVKYLKKEDKIFHDVYIHSKRIGNKRHPLYDFKKRIKQYPIFNFKTTKEMKDEFSFLKDEKLIDEIVIHNTNLINNQIEQVHPLKNKLYTPKIKNSSDNLKSLCYKNTIEKYGEELPKKIKERLIKELDSIIKHGFADIYWISHKLVNKSIIDGYLVGSRGSVGSSFVATMANITEVNPLEPHYICSKCKFCKFVDNKIIKSGYDLQPKKCPNCNNLMYGEGHNIPFETFLGFKGDKVPDIDLNFSGEYQHIAHNFIKEMFGENHVYRAGTISTVAKKTAYGYVKAYFEEKNINDISNVEIERIANGCEGSKRTTGQHPGGIIVIPKEYNVNDFTPVNFPADDESSSWKTTHFDFHAIHDNVLKLDVLGHVDPTALKILENMTKINPKDIPVYDKKVLKLFSDNKVLNLNDNEMFNEKNGAIGLPEFGTQFVRKMLDETSPKSFSDLVQISGLSHGTDVWINNSQTLIKEKNIQLSDVIGCRDDIMTFLIRKGLEPLKSFKIMENVRKGKGLTKEEEKLMLENNIPKWYIESCKKIKYMFPKAHATAYVLMAWRVAWYKINYPHEYYATFFTTRTDVFDIKTIASGPKIIKEKIDELNELINKKEKISQKDKDLIPIYEVALEMWLRGIEMTNIDIKLSKEKSFDVIKINNKKKIIPPFTAIDGLGLAVSSSIVKARNNRNNKLFNSIEDFQKSTNITKTHLLFFKEIGALSELPDRDQIDIFNI